MNDELRYLLGRTVRGRMNRRDFLGRAAALGVSAATANTLLATAVRAEGPIKGGTLRFGLQGGESTSSLDPALAASQVPFQNLSTIGEPLVEVGPDGSIVPRVAEAVDSTPDAKTWTFTIRKGIEFHNGKTLTPDDVLATLQRHSDEKSQSGALGIMQGIESMTVDGDHVVVTLATPNADLPYLMADYHLMMQPNGGRDSPADGIMSGPYKVVRDEPGVRHVFERFANYWDPTRGHVDTIENIVINDPTARMAALQSGQVHVVNRVEPRTAALLSRAPGVSVTSAKGRGHYVFIMRCDAAPFDNKDLRLALKYAINRQQMLDTVLAGYGSLGNDIPINASYPLFDESWLPQREYDPEKAAFHYKASGHDGSPIVLRTSDVAFPGAIDAAALFQQSAAAAGIPLEIQREPGDGYWSEVWNKQPFCASYWGGRPVQDQMYSTAYQSSADWNDTAFKNERFDQLMQEARGELDQAKRKDMYGEMARILHEEGGLICPMFNDFVEAHGPEVQGWFEDPTQELMNGLAGVKLWLSSN
ncbi:ABC transporter substrate-binding protein [Rubellimicrobium arenae]|uniref:ABC transporter substrate-binding protein n=1 Tax=Rubellimicrobium arenae TaxID=2817372 RepID=UPI001B3003F3|nr:ABC transporter substrate-binding protein [Rubellimicrobium arenae]